MESGGDSTLTHPLSAGLITTRFVAEDWQRVHVQMEGFTSTISVSCKRGYRGSCTGVYFYTGYVQWYITFSTKPKVTPELPPHVRVFEIDLNLTANFVRPFIAASDTLTVFVKVA